MIPDNDWYGHKLAFAHYCGLQRSRPIFGSLVHGWYPDIVESVGRRKISSAPLFVWNQRHLKQAAELAIPNVQCVGAPFLYARQNLLGSSAPDVRPGSGTFVLPAHSGESTQHDFAVRRLIDSVEQDFSPPFTISIYYQDFAKPHTDRFRDAGWRVVSFGSRNEPMFLYRLIFEMSRHKALVADSPQTGVWYGAALGLHVTVVGGARWTTGASRNSLPNRWPELDGGIDGEAAMALAAIELGQESMRSPKELASLLGWTSPAKRVLAGGIGRLADYRYGKELRSGLISAKHEEYLRNRSR